MSPNRKHLLLFKIHFLSPDPKMTHYLVSQ